MLKAKDLTVSQILSSEANYFATLQDFKKLAPNSQTLNQDFSGFYSSNSNYINIGGGLSALLGFSIYNKKRAAYLPNCTLRLGFQGYSVSQLSQGFIKENTVALDTLYSASTQTTVYIDSNYHHYINLSKNATNLALDFSVIFNSNPERRFQLHGGIGLTTGAAIASNTSVYESESTKLIVRTQDSYYSGNSNFSSDYTQENYRNKTGLVGSIYFPLGYNFRLSNKREHLKNIYLFGEIRPAVSITQIPELFVNVNTSFSGIFGVRFVFKNAVKP